MSQGSAVHGPPGAVPLSMAIAGLRETLFRAWWDGQRQSLRFKPSPVELTLQVAMTATGTAKTEVNWWLIALGGELSRGSVVTQTIKVTLDPMMFDASGRAVEVLIDAPGDGTDALAAHSGTDPALDTAEQLTPG